MGLACLAADAVAARAPVVFYVVQSQLPGIHPDAPKAGVRQPWKLDSLAAALHLACLHALKVSCMAEHRADAASCACPCHAQGKNPTAQRELDELMMSLDGTDNKGKLGANAILAVSMAVAKVRLMADGCSS